MRPLRGLTPLVLTLAAFPAAGLEVLVVFPPDAEITIEGELVVEAPGGSVQRLPVRGRGAVEVPEAALPQRLRTAIPGWWAPPQVVTGHDEPVTVRLVPTGTLAGRLERPPGASPPGELRVHFATAASPGTSPADAFPCHLDDDATAFACEVPQGRRDLALRESGFAPIYLWQVEVPPRGRVDAGPLAMVPGASLSGFVEAAEAPVPSSQPAVVELRRGAKEELSSHPTETVVERLAVGPRGFFQFTDLAPGAYSVIASAPGLVAAREGPLQVHAGRESRLLQPLRLEPPVALEVLVHPPHTPAGAAWQLELMRLPPRGEGEHVALGDPSGAARLAGLAPGLYELSVHGDEGLWWRQEVAVAPAQPPLEVELGLVPVEGRVTWRGEPVSVRLTFTQEGRTIALASDAAGRFDGLLPAPGPWEIAFRFHPLGAAQTMEPVEVAAGTEPAYVEIEIPDTRIQGVVTAGGEPVAGVRIGAWNRDRRSGTARTTTNRHGRFLYRGLRPGSYTLTVLEPARSAAADVEVRDGKVEDVEIELPPAATLEGEVATALGPAAGAVVQALPRTAEPRRVPVAEAATDLAGRFRLELPADTRAVDLLVLAPGAAARLLRLPFPAPSPVRIEVDDLAGDLAIEAPSRRELAALVLHHGDAAFPVEPFRWWESLHGRPPGADRRTLPRLAAGSYRVCSATACHGVDLAPGGEATVRFAPPPIGTESAPAEPRPGAREGVLTPGDPGR